MVTVNNINLLACSLFKLGKLLGNIVMLLNDSASVVNHITRDKDKITIRVICALLKESVDYKSALIIH